MKEQIINPNTFKGNLTNKELLIRERGGDNETALVLHGFDEIGLFDHKFKNPEYVIVHK